MKSAQGRCSGEIPENDYYLVTCNGCGRSRSGNAPMTLMLSAIEHEKQHHKHGHPEGFTVEVRDETED